VSTLKDLISRQGVSDETAGIGTGPWFGTVIGPVPTALQGNLWVDIPDISYMGQLKFGPCFWSKTLLPTGVMPALGSPVLVIFDNRQQPWVVSIWQ
jgi:hypothetical protein